MKDEIEAVTVELVGMALVDTHRAVEASTTSTCRCRRR
jgi:hypothetical protein